MNFNLVDYFGETHLRIYIEQRRENLGRPYTSYNCFLLVFIWYFVVLVFGVDYFLFVGWLNAVVAVVVVDAVVVVVVAVDVVVVVVAAIILDGIYSRPYDLYLIIYK